VTDGDHTIFVGEVEGAAVRREKLPLRLSETGLHYSGGILPSQEGEMFRFLFSPRWAFNLSATLLSFPSAISFRSSLSAK
jgi:hypothetical protein